MVDEAGPSRPKDTSKRGGRWLRTLDGVAHALGKEGDAYTRVDAWLEGTRVLVLLEFGHRRTTLPTMESFTEREARAEDRVPVALQLIAKFEGHERSASVGDPPSIELRRETNADRGDKRSGLVKEVQTGFETFDRKVFVHNDSSDEDAKRLLSKEATRQAIMRLLDAGYASVHISTTSVTVRRKISELEERHLEVEPVLSVLDDLRIVARAGPPREARPERRGESTAPMLIGIGLLALTYGFWTTMHFETGWLPVWVGLFAGVVLSLLLRPALEDDVRGDSGSAGRAAQLTFGAFCTVTGLVMGVLVHLNVFFDSSEPEVEARVVQQVVKRGSRTEQYQVALVRGLDGALEEVPWSGVVRPGDRFVVKRRAGAFGVQWVEGRDLVLR